jgi:N utilization substance protein B
VSGRSKARKRALDVLFEAESRGVPALDVLAERINVAHPPLNDYVSELVTGVVANSEQIDALLTQNTAGWPLDRMPAVDRNVLRLGVYEVLKGEVPPAVVLSQAVELVADLSTDESPAFVNGLLAKIVELKPQMAP